MVLFDAFQYAYEFTLGTINEHLNSIVSPRLKLYGASVELGWIGWIGWILNNIENVVLAMTQEREIPSRQSLHIWYQPRIRQRPRLAPNHSHANGQRYARLHYHRLYQQCQL